MYHRTSAKKAVIGCEYSAGILEQSMGARNREEILWLLYRSVSIHTLAESIPGLLKSLKFRLSFTVITV
jgi:hypothetical protein